MEPGSPQGIALTAAAVVALTVLFPPVLGGVACFEGGTVIGGPFALAYQCNDIPPHPPGPWHILWPNLGTDLLLWSGVAAVAWMGVERRKAKPPAT